MTYDIRAKLYMDNADYEKKLRAAAKQTASFGKSMKTISNGVKAVWAGVAVGVVGNLYDSIVDVTKAAAEDAKSQALLNKQMDNSFKATQKQKEEMDRYIDTMSNMSGIADDSLRPAMSKLVAVSKNATKAQKAFAVVLDISAGTGKDVNVVAQAYSKYLGGNKTALDKLVPGLKDAGDKMAFLQSKYGGMAAVAGKNDPFARINVVMDNFKEKLGTAFLPVVDKFADWLASGESQKAMDDLAAKVAEFGEWFASPEGQKSFNEWIDGLKDLIKLADDFLGIAGKVASLFDQKAKDKALTKAAQSGGLNYLGGGQTPFLTTPKALSGNMMLPPIKTGPTTINITITAPNVSGQAVIDALKKNAKSKGIPLGKMLVQ